MSDIDSKLISGEEVVFKTTKHWMAPLADSKWAILMILGALVLAWLQTDSTTGLFGFVNRVLGLFQIGLFLGGVGWIIYNVVAWQTAEYHVTNRRVLGHDGLLRSRSTDTLLTSISDVRSTISALGRGLGYGNVQIMSASGEAGADSFTTVREVDAFKKQILEQKSGSAAMAESRSVEPAAALPSATTPTAPAPPTASDITTTLADLAKLRDAGAITAAEYDAKKADLLARI